MESTSSSQSKPSRKIKVVHDLTSEEEIKEYVKDLSTNTMVVAELFDEFNGFCHEFPDCLEKRIIRKEFSKIKFIRFDAGNDLKGFNECHSTHSSHSYPAYRFYQKVGNKGDLKLKFIDYIAPMENARFDLTDDKHFGKVPMQQKQLVELVQIWITENMNKLDPPPPPQPIVPLSHRWLTRASNKEKMEEEKKKNKGG